MDKESAQKKKVIYVCDDLMLGGWTSIVAMILEMRKRGYLVSVVTLFGKGYYSDLLEKDGVKVECLYLTKLNLPFKLLKLFLILKKEKPDVVHTNLHYSDTFGILCAYAAGVEKRIIHIHSIREKYRHPLQTLKKIVMSKVSKAIAVSHAASEDFKRDNPAFAAEIEVIPNGINICEFRRRFSESKMRKKDFRLSENTFTVLTVANFKWQKGYEYLVEAAEIIGEGVHFLVAGYGPEEGKIKKMVAERKLDGKLTFLGARTDVPEIMKVADAFLLPSVVEPFGICIVEAFSVGMPVMASAVDGVKEISRHMVNAILVEPANPEQISDAIKRLRSEEKLRQTLKGNAILASEDFKIEKISDYVQKEYERLD